MFFFFFGISLLFDVILCESYDSSGLNLFCMICRVLFVIFKEEKHIKKMCTSVTFEQQFNTKLEKLRAS